MTSGEELGDVPPWWCIACSIGRKKRRKTVISDSALPLGLGLQDHISHGSGSASFNTGITENTHDEQH